MATGSDAMRRRVVVVGGGFGGLEVVRRLADADLEVLLIDRENHHCFQPLLYQVATAALSPAEIAWPIRALLRRQANVTVLMAEVDGVDRVNRCVTAGPRRFAYDHLVIATGATHSYFGRDDWGVYAPGLKRIEDATRIRRNILLAFERAELADDPAERMRLLTFVVVGGGPTGVELAGAVAEVACQALARDFRRANPREAKILLIEAGPRLLAAFPQDLSDYAAQTLQRMGVRVELDTRVTKIDAQGVETDKGRLDCATAVWAAGVIASPAARWLGVAPDRAGRVPVDVDLRLPEDRNIFVIGDTALVMDAQGTLVPGVAPAAKQMGRHVADAIMADLRGAPARPFSYRHQGDLATIGRKAAVVKIGRIKLRGFIAWLFWSVAHVYFLIGTRNRLVVALSWLVTYVTFQRGARLVTNPKDAPPQDHAPL